MAPVTALFLASAAATQAQTTLAAWTFDNLALGINGSPQPSTGLGAASAVGLSNRYNHTNSVSNPDIQSLPGSSSGGANSWRLRGSSTVAGSGGNGWSTNAPIGTQGAQFTGSTFGYYKIKVTFDVYATADAEANLQAQYSTDGSHWFNANIVSAGAGVIVTNTTSANTVNGTYIALASGWNNQVTVDLSGVSGADNAAGFAVRFVNASTGADCVDTAGAIYNNTSGNWTLDNVVIQGRTIDTVTSWDFDVLGIKAAPYNNPAPTTGSGTAQSLGMINGYTFQDGSVGSSNWCDILLQGGSSTGPNSLCWRVRGGITGAGAPNSGWNRSAPIASQGAEFDVNTGGYTNIVCSFDLYFTTQAPDKVCVVYTTDGWVTTNLANTFFYGANAAYILTNASSPNTVTGTYFYQTFGQGCNTVRGGSQRSSRDGEQSAVWLQGGQRRYRCELSDHLGQLYNNQSGNIRFGNVAVGALPHSRVGGGIIEAKCRVRSRPRVPWPGRCRHHGARAKPFDAARAQRKELRGMPTPSSVVTALPASGIRRMMAKASAMSDVARLDVGEPQFATPAHIVEAAFSAATHGATKYTASGGLQSTREAIAAAIAADTGTPVTWENVVVTVGAVGALISAVRAVLDAGDELLVPDPGGRTTCRSPVCRAPNHDATL